MSAPRLGLVARTPFLSVPRLTDPMSAEVYVQRSDRNICAYQDSGSPCDTASGSYYTGEDERSAALCPRHFYELHFGANASCLLRTLPQRGDAEMCCAAVSR